MGALPALSLGAGGLGKAWGEIFLVRSTNDTTNYRAARAVRHFERSYPIEHHARSSTHNNHTDHSLRLE